MEESKKYKRMVKQTFAKKKNNKRGHGSESGSGSGLLRMKVKANMGRYSYSQPSSSSDELDIDSILQAEADLYAEEAESSHNVEPVLYPPQPAVEDGIPKTCYCGSDTIVATAYTRKDQGRRYITCDNADDGYCHVWKWWDVAVTEEMSEFERQLRQLRAQANETQQSLVNLDKAVEELAKKKSRGSLVFPLGFCVLVVVLLACMVFMFKWFEDKDGVIIEFMEELQRLQMRVSDL